MRRFKNILAVVDDESPDQIAIKHAAELAAANGSKLKLVSVIRELSWLKKFATPHYGELEQKLREEKTDKLNRLAESLRGDGFEITTKLLHGKSSIAIIREVLRDGHDLVFKEAKGNRGFKGFFGTTGLLLLRHCPCPVWMVKPGPHIKYEFVMAAINTCTEDELHIELNREILELANSICAQEQSRLQVVQAWDVYGESIIKNHMQEDEFKHLVEKSIAETEKSIDGVIQAYNLSHKSDNVHLLHGDAGLVIPKFANEQNTDLIVMGTVARTGVSGALTGNTAEMIMGTVECSLLALKPSEFVSPVTPDS